MQIFQCEPLSYIWLGWKGGYGDYTCLNVHALTYTAAGFSIAQDVVIFVMPIPLLTSLNASMHKRSQILFMFSLGFFVLLTSCIRLGFIVHFAASWNPTWDYNGPLIWSGLELGVSMIVTSLPAIRVMLTRTVPNIFGGSQNPASSGTPPMGYSGHGAIGYVKSKSNQQWTPFSSGERSRLDDESEIELALRTEASTRVEIKAQPPPEVRRHPSIRESVLSTFPQTTGG